MNIFADSLKKSLSAVNDGFAGARQDMIDITGDLTAAVQENTGKPFSVGMYELDANIRGTTYRLAIDENVDDESASIVTLTCILTPPTGYPLQTGSYNKVTKKFLEDGGVLSSREEFEGYLNEMVNNPDSKLIQTIGWFMRKPKN